MAKTPSAASVKSYAVGLHKGFVVTKRKEEERPASRKKRTSERVRTIRKMMRGLTGLTSIEKRILEMLKTGVSKVEKRAFKLLKSRYGTRSRAIKKREELNNIIKNMSKKAA